MSADQNSLLIRADVFAIARPLARNLRALARVDVFKCFFREHRKITHFSTYVFKATRKQISQSTWNVLELSLVDSESSDSDVEHMPKLLPNVSSASEAAHFTRCNLILLLIKVWVWLASCFSHARQCVYDQ